MTNDKPHREHLAHEPEISAGWAKLITAIVLGVLLALTVWSQAEAATIRVSPSGTTIGQAYALAQDGDTISIAAGTYLGQTLEVAKRITFDCPSRKCVFSGQRKLAHLFTLRRVRAVYGLTVRGYIHHGFRTKRLQRARIMHNRFERIGSRWGCHPSFTGDCWGFSAIGFDRGSTDNYAAMNTMINLLNHQGKANRIHCFYVSHGSHRNVIEHNHCSNVSGTAMKVRNGSNGVVIRYNVVTNAPDGFFVDGPMKNEKRSAGAILEGNSLHNTGAYIRCRNPGGKMQHNSTCVGWGVVTDRGRYLYTGPVPPPRPVVVRPPVRPPPPSKQCKNVPGRCFWLCTRWGANHSVTRRCAGKTGEGR